VALVKKLRAEQTYLSRFMIKSSSRVIFIKTNEVDWIESASNYALLHVGEKIHLIRETMQALETKLCPKNFQRVSRSVIVNLERVKELQPLGKGQYIIILASGKQLTMSRGIRDLQTALGPALGRNLVPAFHRPVTNGAALSHIKRGFSVNGLFSHQGQSMAETRHEQK